MEGRKSPTPIQNKTCKYNEKHLGFTNVKMFLFAIVRRSSHVHADALQN